MNRIEELIRTFNPKSVDSYKILLELILDYGFNGECLEKYELYKFISNILLATPQQYLINKMESSESLDRGSQMSLNNFNQSEFRSERDCARPRTRENLVHDLYNFYVPERVKNL